MKILKIALKNLNSLKLDTVIDFTTSPMRDAGLFAIVGDTGAGKTTILDALTLGLYGRIHRNKMEGEVLSYGTVSGHAEVEFLVKEEVYVAKWIVWRSRGKIDGKINTKRELAQWNKEKEIFEILEDKTRAVNVKIELITGLDFERFTKSVMLSQGDFAAFLKAGDKERSNLLEQITGTDIYSRISIAAFQKHKQEEQELDSLKLKLDALQILDKETLSLLKKEQKELAKDSKHKQKELVAIQAQIQWRNRIVELTAEKEKLGHSLHLVEQSIVDASSDFAKLARHFQTVVFQKEITKIENLEEHHASLTSETTLAKAKIERLQQRKIELANAHKASILSLKELKIQNASKEKLFHQVSALDVKIETKEIPLNNLIKEQLDLHEETKNCQKKIDLKTAENEENETSLKNIEDWLEKEKAAKELEGILPAITLQINEWADLTEKVEQSQKEKVEKLAELRQAQTFVKEYEKQLGAHEEALKSTLDNFKNLAEGVDLSDRNQYLKNLSGEIGKLEGQYKHLEDLIDLNKAYLQDINQLNEYEEEEINLRKVLYAIENDLLTAVELVEELKTTFKFKEEIFEREKLFAGFQREREKLKEGEECPLCLATAHPFRQLKQFKVYTNEAEQEFLAIKLDVEKQQKKVRILSMEQSTTTNEILQIRGEVRKNRAGKKDLILKRIKEQERKIANLIPNFQDETLYTTSANILEHKLTVLQLVISEKKSQQETLFKLDSDILNIEKNIASLKTQFSTKQIALNSAQEIDKGTDKNLTDLIQRKDNLQTSITKVISTYTLSLGELSGPVILEKLAKKKTDYEKVADNLIRRKEVFQQTKQELKQLKANQKDLLKRKEKMDKQVEKLELELSTLKKDRAKLFGEEAVEIVRNQQRLALENKESGLETLSQQHKTAEIALTSEIAKNKKNEKDLEKTQKDLVKQEQVLLEKIQPKGFDSIVAIKIANLAPDEVLLLENKKSSLEKKQTQWKQSLKNSSKALDKTIAQALTTESLETLNQKLELTNQERQELDQQIGKITQQLEDNDRLKQAGKELVEKMDIQQKEYRRWAKLKEIIGAADGKVFRAFAQGLTLKKLSELANKHLLQLNGRYLIHKPSDRDLTLEIIDQHHANNTRSIHTLSGGESFLVSLALALGLSDLAGRKTQIKSLFIDEGFGTLDESALDLAISTLENLQSKGKRIGVISHVHALKERITTQIQVRKKGSGFSELVIQ